MARSAKATAQTEKLPPSLLAIVLSRFECIQFPPEASSEEKEMMLQIAVSPFEKGPDLGQFFTQVMCKCARRRDSNAPEAYFTAIYSVLARTDAVDVDQATAEAKDWVAAAAWQNFSNLFNISNGQMHTEMPSLPFGPNGVSVKPLEYLIGAFDILDQDDSEED